MNVDPGGFSGMDLAASAKAGPLVASIAGAVVSLAFLEKLTVRGRIAAVGVGFATAVFVAPIMAAWVAHHWPWLGPVENGVHFMVSLCAMGTLPAMLKTIRAIAGGDLSIVSALLKVRVKEEGAQ